jgi:hypothetical protein
VGYFSLSQSLPPGGLADRTSLFFRTVHKTAGRINFGPKASTVAVLFRLHRRSMSRESLFKFTTSTVNSAGEARRSASSQSPLPRPSGRVCGTGEFREQGMKAPNWSVLRTRRRRRQVAGSGLQMPPCREQQAVRSARLGDAVFATRPRGSPLCVWLKRSHCTTGIIKIILAAPNALKIPDPPRADSATVTGLGKWHFFWVCREMRRSFEQLDDSKGAHVLLSSRARSSVPTAAADRPTNLS